MTFRRACAYGMEPGRSLVETMRDKLRPGWLDLCRLNQQTNDPLLDMNYKMNKTTAHVDGCVISI